MPIFAPLDREALLLLPVCIEPKSLVVDGAAGAGVSESESNEFDDDEKDVVGRSSSFCHRILMAAAWITGDSSIVTTLPWFETYGTVTGTAEIAVEEHESVDHDSAAVGMNVYPLYLRVRPDCH